MIAAGAGRRKQGAGLAPRAGFPEDGVVPPAPPAPVDLLALADQCVQCGLCLPSCPTYRLEGLETESPRGRIALVRAWESGPIAPTPAADAHLDACLGCRRCEAVCPAGVRYGALLTEARTRQRRRRPPSWRHRTIEALAARPGALSALLEAYRIAWPLLPQALRPLPRPPAKSGTPTFPKSGTATLPDTREPGQHIGQQVGDTHFPSDGLVAPAPDATAALFVGCVARAYEAPLRAAVVRLAAAAGLRLIVPPGQTCCGSLHAHAGDPDRAEALATINRTAFAGQSLVLGLASGCHEALSTGLAGQVPIRDAIEAIAERADRLRFAPRPERVALHLPCTQRNVVRSDAALRALLARVPGLEVVELDAGFGCCGAAGTAMLTDPARAERFRRPLLDQLRASGATRLLSANIGCRLHLQAGSDVPVEHPLGFLAQCLP
jgi:glycolate oxidase iron-sulfur subunit